MRAGKPGAMRRVLTAVLLLTALHVTAPLFQGPPVAAAVPPGSLVWPAAPPSPSPECMSPLALDGGDGPGLNGAKLAGFGWTAPDEWQLPPALSCAEPDAADGVGVGPTVWAGDGRGDARGPAAGSGRRFTCGVCNTLEAKRGVVDPHGSGCWAYFVCRTCLPHIKAASTVQLAARCRVCSTYATFGAPGESRQDATHCKRHRLPGEVCLKPRTPSASAAAARGRSSSVDLLLSSPRRPGTRSPSLSPPSSPPPGELGWDALGLGAPPSSLSALESAVDSDSGSLGVLLAESCAVRKRGRRRAPAAELPRSPLALALEGSSIDDSSAAAAERSSARSESGSGRCAELCLRPDCGRAASFGGDGAGRARVCEVHRAPGDVQVHCRPSHRCQHPGCGTRGSYGDERPRPGGGAAPRFCGRHRQEHHVVLSVARCKGGSGAGVGACRKQPSFGPAGGGAPLFCSEHRGPDDVNVRHGHERCSADGCGTMASFGNAGAGQRGIRYCGRHRAPGHVNLRYLRRLAAGQRRRRQAEAESEWLLQHLGGGASAGTPEGDADAWRGAHAGSFAHPLALGVAGSVG